VPDGSLDIGRSHRLQVQNVLRDTAATVQRLR